jgi:hypothetical protein
MESFKFNHVEKQMTESQINDLKSANATAVTNIAKAQTAADVKTEICNIWKKIRPFVIILTSIPVVGNYLKILFELLDSICPS